MLTRFRYLIAFIVLFLAASMACSFVSGGTPSAQPVQQPPAQQPAQPPAQPQAPVDELPQPSSSDTGSYVTFTDQNGLYSIVVPADWIYSQTYDSENNYYYIDTFKSPDGGAVIENIVYDDGTKFTGNQKGKFALSLLNTFYRSTGKEGDIRVSDDKIMKDGSERLTWTSKGGGYSGISFLEVRSNGTTFMFFTVDWGDSVKDTYIDTLNAVIASYTIP